MRLFFIFSRSLKQMIDIYGISNSYPLASPWKVFDVFAEEQRRGKSPGRRGPVTGGGGGNAVATESHLKNGQLLVIRYSTYSKINGSIIDIFFEPSI